MPEDLSISALLRRDPGTFVLGFAAWAALSGASLVWPGDAFQLNPIYGEVARLGVADTWWGAAMLADAGLLALSAVRGKAAARAVVAMLSAPFWFYFGGLLLAGGADLGLFSPGGAFDALGAIGLAAAAAQWAHVLAAPAIPDADEGENEPWT